MRSSEDKLLQYAIAKITEIATGFGLDFYPMRYEICPADIIYPALTGSNTPTSKFGESIVQLQRLESPAVSPPRTRQKAPLCQVLQRPAILNEPLPLFLRS